MISATDVFDGLPTEIIEMIISYLDGNDVLRCCRVCRGWSDVFDTERTWSVLCRRQGWTRKGRLRSNGWRNHYWSNYNWRAGIYTRYHRSVSESGGLQVNLNGRSVIMSHVLGTQIWNFDDTPSFHQNIYCEDYHFQTHTCSKSIVIKLKDSVRLYVQDKRDERYKSIKTISSMADSKDYDPDLDLGTAIMQTGCNRLAIVQKQEKDYTMLFWNLTDGRKYTPVRLEGDVKHVFKIVLFNDRFYLVTLNENEYRIKIYDLHDPHDQSRCMEIVAFRNIAFGVIPPELQVNERHVVAFCPTDIGRDLCYGYSPLKVWDSTGRIVGSIILNSGRIDYFAFCLSDDLVIYRHSETVVKVWKPSTDQDLCRFNVEPKICKIDKSIGSLFVLSYESHFDVCDYKSGDTLYRVVHVDDSYSVIHGRIEVNEYYYVKQDRIKKSMTVFSFKDRSSDEHACDDLFVSKECKTFIDRSVNSKGVM